MDKNSDGGNKGLTIRQKSNEKLINNKKSNVVQVDFIEAEYEEQERDGFAKRKP